MVAFTILGIMFATVAVSLLIVFLTSFDWKTFFKQMWCTHEWVTYSSRYGWIEWTRHNCKHCGKSK